MCLQVCCVDYHGRLLTVFRCQPRHQPREIFFVAPTFPPAVQSLVRTIGGTRVLPAQPIEIDEDILRRTRLSSTHGLPCDFGKRGELGHLLVSQPVKVAHVTAPFLSRESRRATEINES